MLHVNPKKSITLRNRTNYFIPDKDKVRVTFSSPDSYQSRQIKIEGYETRLYWQFRYCEEHDGQTFFYTLTYNDNAMPQHYGVNCFDYEDLRDLLTGGFRKQLLRKYGTTFKYFIGSELGDGKGERGMHNNPHYHVLFFLESAHDDRYPYVKISPDDFRHLVRIYWQGFDESRDGYKDYNDALYGIAREGENEGKVTDFRACGYCAKYVCKDAKLKQSERKIESKVRFSHFREFNKSEESFREFFKQVINPMFNTPLNAKKTKWCFSEVELIKQLYEDAFRVPGSLFSDEPEDMDNELYAPLVKQIIRSHHLWKEYDDFVNSWIAPLIQDDMTEWRNRFSNKVRISQGVGDYALEFIEDKLNPTIQVPSKKGFKNRPISMYYYRKLYTDVVKDEKGQNLYVLNELGQEYKLAHLSDRMKKMISKCSPYFQLLLGNPELYKKMCESDVNTSVFWSHDRFKRELLSLLQEDSLSNIIKRYAEYKLVYEDRFFSLQSEGDSIVPCFPSLDVCGDYKRFLVPSFYSVPRNDLMLACFLEDAPENYLPYQSHPYFLRYISFFDVLDMCSDYFFIQSDDKRQREAEEIAATKRFHDKLKLQQFYSVFKN